jgi:hypothetical protein
VCWRQRCDLFAKNVVVGFEKKRCLKVKERQSAEEREREEMKGLVLQKVRLVSDSTDDGNDDNSSQRLNKSGMNVKKQQLLQQQQQQQQEASSRVLGRKY